MNYITKDLHAFYVSLAKPNKSLKLLADWSCLIKNLKTKIDNLKWANKSLSRSLYWDYTIQTQQEIENKITQCKIPTLSLFLFSIYLLLNGIATSFSFFLIFVCIKKIIFFYS